MSEIIVKVKYYKDNDLVEIRRFPMSNKRVIKFREFMNSLKTRLLISGSNDEILLKYHDNEGDLITIQSDDEFKVSLGDSLSITYSLYEKAREGSVSTLKSVNNIKAKIKYPDEKLGSGVGDCYEVVFDSKYLVGENRRKSTDIWGTDIYTSDSDYLKALIHSKKIKVTKTPSHDIIATFKIMPGRNSYVGTYVNGIKSLSFGNWDISFSIENYRYDK